MKKKKILVELVDLVGKETRRVYRKATRLKRRSLGGHMWLNLDVEVLATDAAMRKAVSRWLYAHDSHGWPRKTKGVALGLPVEATIVIDAYLTKDVPKKLRERTFTIRSEGEALVKAADMYRRIYEANEKLGGDSALNPDIRKRVASRRKKGSKYPLVNRGFEPYVWGHDISDLVFERMYIKWLDAEEKKKCRITFGIGS